MLLVDEPTVKVQQQFSPRFAEHRPKLCERRLLTRVKLAVCGGKDELHLLPP
jgi:hypothetical protein